MKEKRSVYLLDPKWGNRQCCQMLCDTSIPLFNFKTSFEFPLGRGFSVLNKMRAAGLDDFFWSTETHSTSQSPTALLRLLHPNQLKDRLEVDNYNSIANINRFCITRNVIFKGTDEIVQ
jgi:hypothetical protein